MQGAETYSPCDDDTRLLGIPVHVGGLQPAIPTEIWFRDWLLLSESQLIVHTIAARVWPGGLGAY